MDKSMSPHFPASPVVWVRNRWLFALRGAFAFALFGTVACSNLCGQDKDSDPEAYKLRIEGQFWYANPTATVSGSSVQVPISFDKTFGFND